MKLVKPRVREKRTSSPQFIAKLQTHESADWMHENLNVILRQFKEAAKHVPAYRAYLKKKGVNPSLMRILKDVERIPPATKKDYLRFYSWGDLISTRTQRTETRVLAATSGSTGEPFYVPRGSHIHENAMILHHLFLERSGLSPKKSTLVMVCFGMGVWIGGLITYESFRRIGEGGWSLSLITPGVSKKEIFDALRRVAPSYEQLILCGYPPFIKDVVEEGLAQGINFKKWDMRIVCAAESFSEHFRDHLMQKTGMKNPYRSVMNIYGTVELGAMATETPLTILLRRLALARSGLYTRLFSETNRLPTLAQFIPDFVAFEAREGELYVTGGRAMPLIRYAIGDQGGVFSYAEVLSACAAEGIDLAKEAKRAGIKETMRELPFVYLYERSDLSTKLYGAIIFPEHVKNGFTKRAVAKYVTGRFTLATEHDAAHNEYLAVNVELRSGVSSGEAIRKLLTDSIAQSLASGSDEYRYLQGSIPDRVIPRIVFWPYEHPTYFKSGVKQTWVKRTRST